MTLADPTLLFDSLDTDTLEPSSQKDELTHVSEVLKESGLPVAEDLKDRIMSEILRFNHEDVRLGYNADRRRSA